MSDFVRAASDGGNLSNANSPAKVFVGGLSKTTTTESLQQYVVTLGYVVNECNVLDGKGFGFITFANVEDAEAFVANDGASHTIDGRTVDAKKALPKHMYQRQNQGGLMNDQNNPNKSLLLQLQQNMDMVTKLFVGGISGVSTFDTLKLSTRK